MQPSTLAKRGTVLLFLAVVAFYFYGLGHFPLLGPDEPRYSQVAREMFLRRDLVTPTLGGHTWFEKPALLYWMMIASFKLFGVSEAAARLPAALSGVLTIAAVYCLGRRVDRDEDQHQSYAFWATLAAAATLGIAVFARAASFDIILTMTVTWGLTFYVLYELKDNANPGRWFLAGFYVFIGVSLLAKGLVGIVIPFGVVGFYHIFRRRWPHRMAFISLLWGIPLTLLVAATWYVPVINQHGWAFVDEFFIQHHFARYVSNKYRHWHPVYYYLMIVPLLSLPWTAFFIDGLLKARTLLSNRSSAVALPGERLHRLLVFALAWFLFPLLFFSFGNSKLPGYILPVLPAAALIVGERLWRLTVEPQKYNWPLITTGIFCLVFAGGSFVFARITGDTSLLCVFLLVAPLSVVGFFALFNRSKRPVAVLLVAIAVGTVMTVALNCIAPEVADRESAKRLLQLADARGYSQAAIFGMQRSDRSPEYYAAGRIAYDADGEPTMYEGPFEVVAEARKRGGPVLTFVPLTEVSQLTALAPGQVDVIGDNGRYAIVAVNPKR